MPPRPDDRPSRRLTQARIAQWLHVAVSVTVMLTVQAGTAKAQDAPGAVGLISYSATPRPGTAICTGVLVTDRLVLTAGHCVRRFARNPRTIRFKAGVHKGRAQSIRRAARIVLPLMTGSGGKSVAPDVALVQLDFPVSAEFAQPLPLADGKADRFTLIAYRRDRPQSAERNDDCRTVTASNGLIALTCPVVSGNSGAPLLQWTERGWHVAGVMVASVPAGEIRSWAVEIPPDLRAVIAASP